MALDYIIGGLQLLSAAVNVLALGAFWISPGLRATANRFVINLLVANIIACLALTPALWLHGGLKTSFHMDSSSSSNIESTAEHLFQASNVRFEAEFPNLNDKLARSTETTTVKPLHHHHQHNSKVKRDIEQPDYIDVEPFLISQKKVQESIESVVIERDEHGNIRKFSEKQVVDIQNGDEKDEIHIFEEIAAEPMAVANEAADADEPVATIKQTTSTAHRIHTVYTENSLVFDCTRFFGFDFAAAVGKHI